MNSIYLLLTFFLVSKSTQAANPDVSKCWLCHKYGNSFMEAVPNLAGQNKEYLVNQLTNFKNGSRQDRLLYQMNEIATRLSDEDIEAFAEYFSRLEWTKSSEKNKFSQEEIALMAQGEQLAGMCLGCHSQAETTPPQQGGWPKISGQNAFSIEVQLRNMTTGDRINPFMEFMKSPPFSDPSVQKGLSLYFEKRFKP